MINSKSKTQFPGLTPVAYIFDMDGVLIDSLGLDLKVVNEILTERFQTRVPAEVIRKNFALAIPEFWKAILETAGVSVTDKEFLELVQGYEDLRRMTAFELLPGVLKLLDSITVPVAVASNNADEDVLAILARVGLAKRFDAVVGFTGRKKKPEPDIFLEAASQLGVDPTECVVFEDSVLGVQCAKNAGVFCVGVSTGGDSFDRLVEAGSDMVVLDLTEYRAAFAKYFLMRVFPELSVTAVRINDSKVSLNSTNGTLTCGDGKEFFFKFHTEEGEEETMDEYYNAKLLADAGLPVLKPLFESKEPGTQVLVYEKVDRPTMYEAVERVGNFESFGKMLLQLESDLNEKILEVYLRTLRMVEVADQARCPLYQLFYQRLVSDSGVARVDRFYGDAVLTLPSGEAMDFDRLSRLTWVINGTVFDRTIGEIVEDAKRLLNPTRTSRVAVVTGHGDDHNGNKFVTDEGLLLFDPAFAANNQPALLSFVKSTFHDCFAHPFWLYESDRVDASVAVDLRDREIRVEFCWVMDPFRRASFEQKVQQVWIPLLTELERRGWLDAEWQEILRKAFFCCPFLVTNLLDETRFRPEVSVMALAKAMQVGNGPPLSRRSRDISPLKGGDIKNFFCSLSFGL